MKKSLVAVLIAALLLTLVGCGSSGGGTEEKDPNAGVYTMASAEMFGMEMSAEDVFGDSIVTIELLSGGKAKLTMDGDSGNLSWTLNGDQIELSDSEVTLSGTLVNGVLKLDNWMDLGLNITFVCEEIAGSQAGGQTGNSGSEQSVYGYYDAIAYSVDLTEEGTFPLEPGESLTLNEDGSIDMVIEGEDCHFDTTLEDNEFFYDGVSVGAITEDGLVYIDLNEECRYIFAREGHPSWDEWVEYYK